MKLPYTPLQVAALHAEEEGGLAAALGGMPVVCCSLHSQVAPVCAGIGEGVRVAYLQLPGGALPVSLSDTVRALKERGLVEVAVAVGACVDGDVACVSIASGARVGRGAGTFDVAVCAIGPGSSEPAALSATAGWPPRTRRTRRPRSAAARPCRSRLGRRCPRAASGRLPSHALGARPLLGRGGVRLARRFEALPRASSRTSTSTSAAGARRRAGLPLEHMGRGPDDDPSFFAAAYAAGKLARSRIEGGSPRPIRRRTSRR